MHRPAWLRALIALWGIWFAVALIEPTGIHSCPVHGGAAGQIAGMAGMDMGGMPGMAMSHDQAQPGGDSHKPAGCTCLSLCCCAPTLATPSTRVELADPVVVRTVESHFADAPCPVVERAYALPFANGPPTSV